MGGHIDDSMNIVQVAARSHQSRTPFQFFGKLKDLKRSCWWAIHHCRKVREKIEPVDFLFRERRLLRSLGFW
jgi:hypothetical protein